MNHTFIVHDNTLYSWNITLHIYNEKGNIIDRYQITKHNNDYSFVFSENSELKKEMASYLLNNNICKRGNIISGNSPFAYTMNLTKETILSLL